MDEDTLQELRAAVAQAEEHARYWAYWWPRVLAAKDRAEGVIDGECRDVTEQKAPPAPEVEE